MNMDAAAGLLRLRELAQTLRRRSYNKSRLDRYNVELLALHAIGARPVSMLIALRKAARPAESRRYFCARSAPVTAS